jgi:NADPH2:quinone reductase
MYRWRNRHRITESSIKGGARGASGPARLAGPTGDTMKAAFYETTGGPEVIQFGDLPKPEPKEGEVLVRVGAASLNPIDTYIRSGAVNMPLPKPFIPGCDLAGTIEAVGPGVKQYKVGDRVWGANQGVLGRQGTFAEYAAVHEQWLYPTPAGVPDTDAAAVALVGITAYLGLFTHAHLKADETAFVNGGTGGVGSMVVQMAKAAGATVIATVGSSDKSELCKLWRADRAINYKTEDVPQAIRDFTKGRGVDVWYETLSEHDFVRTFDLMATNGRIILMAGRQSKPVFPVGPFYVKGLSMFGFAMFNASAAVQAEAGKQMSRWLEEKKLKPRIGKSFPLSQAADAHRLQEDNTLRKAGTLMGKIVVVP